MLHSHRPGYTVLAETRHFYYSDAWQVFEERLGSSSTPDRQFVWGNRYLDDLILRDRATTTTLDERLYACQDVNWNATTLVDDSGSVKERYEYDPYGNTTVLSPTFTATARSTSNYAWGSTYFGYGRKQTTGIHAVLNRLLSYDPAGNRQTVNNLVDGVMTSQIGVALWHHNLYLRRDW